MARSFLDILDCCVDVVLLATLVLHGMSGWILQLTSSLSRKAASRTVSTSAMLLRVTRSSLGSFEWGESRLLESLVRATGVMVVPMRRQRLFQLASSSSLREAKEVEDGSGRFVQMTVLTSRGSVREVVLLVAFGEAGVGGACGRSGGVDTLGTATDTSVLLVPIPWGIVCIGAREVVGWGLLTGESVDVGWLPCDSGVLWTLGRLRRGSGGEVGIVGFGERNSWISRRSVDISSRQASNCVS